MARKKNGFFALIYFIQLFNLTLSYSTGQLTLVPFITWRLNFVNNINQLHIKSLFKQSIRWDFFYSKVKKKMNSIVGTFMYTVVYFHTWVLYHFIVDPDQRAMLFPKIYFGAGTLVQIYFRTTIQKQKWELLNAVFPKILY